MLSPVVTFLADLSHSARDDGDRACASRLAVDARTSLRHRSSTARVPPDREGIRVVQPSRPRPGHPPSDTVGALGGGPLAPNHGASDTGIRVALDPFPRSALTCRAAAFRSRTSLESSSIAG